MNTHDVKLAATEIAERNRAQVRDMPPSHAMTERDVLALAEMVASLADKVADLQATVKLQATVTPRHPLQD